MGWKSRSCVVAFGLVACGHSASDSSCGEPAPALSDCVVGDVAADCGGSGGAVLACTDYACKWFATSCVAIGYTASTCPADNVCCYGEGLRKWPFPTLDFSYEASSLLVGFGTAPFGLDRGLVLPVTIDPELEHGDQHATCEGTSSFSYPGDVCSAGVTVAVQPRTFADYVSFALLPPPNLSGWAPVIEIDTRVPYTARVCAERFTDVSMCPSYASTDCASSGTITLDRLPLSAADVAALAGRVDVQLGTMRFRASF